MTFYAFPALLLAMIALCGSTSAQEKVRFPSLDGDLTGAAPTQIEGLLYRQPADAPAPAIILAHGCGGLYGRADAIERAPAFLARYLKP